MAERRIESDFQRQLNELLRDPGFREQWEADEPEFQLRKAIIQARLDTQMTQAQLAEATGMDQRAISRIETGGTNPTLRTMGRIAQGFGKKLRIEFV